MALTAPQPHTGAAPDLVTIAEAVALFAETPHQVDAKTLRRWAAKHGIPTEKDGKDLIASWTDLQEVHRDEIDRRDGVSARRR